MRWKSLLTPSTPVVAVLLLGFAICLCSLSKPAPRLRRLSKGEKRELRRISRSKGRSFNRKRSDSKRKAERARLVGEMGVDQFRIMVQENKRQREESKVRLQAALDDPTSLRLVVDLNWAESLSDKELSSLAKQVCYVYGRVKANLKPPLLTLASYGGRAADIMRRWGAESWLVDRNPLSVFQLFDPERVVYLSPDAEDPLEEVLDSEIYVVGGIVDRNLNRGLTLAAAKGGHARVVRLPFDEYLPEVSSRDRVLTVVACVGALMGRHAGGGWKEVLEMSVPRRGQGYDVSRRARGAEWRGADGSGWGPRTNELDGGVATNGDRADVVEEEDRDDVEGHEVVLSSDRS